MKVMKRLFIITGATGGIGSAVLSMLDKENVCCLCRKEVKNVAKCIRTDFSSIDVSYIEELLNWIKSYDDVSEIVLIMTASTIAPIDAIGTLQDSIVSNININVSSQVRIVDAIVRTTKERATGLRIIQFDSGAAYRPLKGWAFYCSAKAYMSIFLKVLSSENPEYRVVLFDPGVVDTGMQRNIRESVSEVFTDKEMFKSYEEKNQLNDPRLVAKFVYERYLADWKAESLNEKFSIGVC